MSEHVKCLHSFTQKFGGVGALVWVPLKAACDPWGADSLFGKKYPEVNG